MKKSIQFDNLMFIVLSVLIVFIPLREIIAFYTMSLVKSIPDMLVLIMFVGYLIKTKFKIHIDKTDLLFGLYLLWELVSTLFINHLGLKPYILQVRSISLYYVLYYILKNYKFSTDTYQRLIPVIKSVLYLLFALAIIEKLFAKTILFPIEWKESIIYMDNFIRTYGMFNNPNTFAAFILFSFIYAYQQLNDFWEKQNWLFIFACISTLLLTVSRSTILLLIFFFMVLAIAQWLLKKRDVKILLIAAKPFLICVSASLLVWGGAEAFSNYYMDNVVYAGEDNTGVNSLDRFNELTGNDIIQASQVNGRLFSITKGLEIVKDYPVFGSGFGTYGSAASLMCGSPLYEKYGIEGTFYSDNEYIKVLTEGGVIGALLFVCFLGSVLYNYRKEKFKLLICVIMGGLGLFYNIFEVQILVFLFWTTMAAPIRTELKGETL